MYNEAKEFDWNAEIEDDSEGYSLLAEGDYSAKITFFERSRYEGSEKLPPCPVAVLTLAVDTADSPREIKTKLYLCKRMEWKLSEFFRSIAAEDLALYRPVFRWEYDPPTGRQLAYLEKCGISTGAVSCKGMANLLIDKLVRRQNEGLCTPRQIRCLESFGYSGVGSWPFEKASQTITGLARNGWRR